MGNKAKLFLARKRKRRNVASMEKARAQRKSNIKNGLKQYLDCTTPEQKIDEFKQEPLEASESGYGDKKDYDESRNDTLTPINEIMYELKQEKIEMTIESGDDDDKKDDDDDKKDDDESRNDTLRQSPFNEELWVVRKQLCRGCHSDGAFWSLQTTTEGDTYGALLQTYFNIQLCPVSEDESALSAICTLCAARLREARAFSAQAHAAEERFTRLYKQNRVRALVNEVVISKYPPKIINEVDDFELSDDVEPDIANSNLDNSKLSIDELAPTLNNYKETQERCNKPASKKYFRLSPSDYERVGNLFKCPQCAHFCDKLYNKRGIHNHVKNEHFKSQKYTCRLCDKTFTKLCDLRYHKKVSHAKRLEKVVLSPSDIERVGNSYKCTRCEKKSRHYREVRYHVMFTHLKLPRHCCLHCDQTFHGLATFTKHKLVEHSIDDRLKCNACDWSTFLSKTALTKHKNAFHMLGVKLSCADCDYFCYSKSALIQHVVKHSTVKKHHCKYCKKSFLRKTTLNFHERIHTGDKRKVCNVCEQAFVQRASLTYHMAKHHPEVRF